MRNKGQAVNSGTTGSWKKLREYLTQFFVNRKGSTMTGCLTISTDDGDQRFVQIVYSADDAWSGYFRSDKIRGTSIVQDGDLLAHFVGRGWDGDSYVTGANIRFVVDGTPGDGDMPTSIYFYTTPDGSATPVLNLVILPDGGVQMPNLKSGATQVGAGAAAGELWITASHATLPNGVVMRGS